MMTVEAVVAAFEFETSWDAVRRYYLPGPMVCPRCHVEITGEKPKKKFLEMRRAFCQACGQKFTPTEGTPLHGTRWQPEELVKLVVLNGARYELARIGQILGKSPRSCRDMLDRIEIYSRQLDGLPRSTCSAVTEQG